MKKFISLFLCFCLTGILFTACGEEDDVPSRVIPSGADTLNIETTTDPSLNINNSWWLNFAATFTYYCPAAGFGADTVIREAKTTDAFLVSDLTDNYFKYYADSEAGLNEYVVVPSQGVYEHNVLSAASVNNINSMFMKITAVAENFTDGDDVIYTGTELVADRNCLLYLQRTYDEDGSLSSVAYLWIDAIYGFCSKCITYDENNNIVLSWALSEFRAGDVTDAEIAPDLTQYNFTEGAADTQ